MTKPGKAALARARRLYEAGDVPLGRIADQLHMSAAAFRALRKREQWPPRAGDQPAPKAPAQDPDEGSLDTRALERRLVRALRREIARAEGEIEQAAPPGAERKARILGLLVKTLGDLRKLGSDERQIAQKDDTHDSSDDGRDLAALRATLAGRLGALRKPGTDG